MAVDVERYIPRELPNEKSELTVGAIIGAAKADMERRARNTARMRSPGGYEHYAFHRAHVAKCGTAALLIEWALNHRADGISSGKKWTRLIYTDGHLLQEAHKATVFGAQ